MWQMTVGLADLLERRPEGGDQLDGQPLDEADRVGQEEVRAVREGDAPQQRVERREQVRRGVALFLGQQVEQGRLAGARVADEGDRGHRALAAALALARAPFLQRVDLPLDPGDAVGDPPAVDLELLFARAARADPGSLLGQAEPLAAQAGQAIAQLGQLDLELALVRPGPLGEDVEDELGPVDGLDLDLVLDVPLLGGVEGVVEDDQVGRGLPDLTGDLGDLPLADEPAGVETRPDLEDLPDDLGPGRRGQAGQLGHRLLGLRLFGPGRGHVDEYRAFHGIPGPIVIAFGGIAQGRGRRPGKTRRHRPSSGTRSSAAWRIGAYPFSSGPRPPRGRSRRGEA